MNRLNVAKKTFQDHVVVDNPGLVSAYCRWLIIRIGSALTKKGIESAKLYSYNRG